VTRPERRMCSYYYCVAVTLSPCGSEEISPSNMLLVLSSGDRPGPRSNLAPPVGTFKKNSSRVLSGSQKQISLWLKIQPLNPGSHVGRTSCSSSLIHPHPASSILIQPHLSSSILIQPHPSSSSLIHPHPASSILIQPHPSSSILIQPHPSSSILIQPHPSSSILIQSYTASSSLIHPSSSL